jgi:NTE family protein
MAARMTETDTRVAIACQGGGTHTAFTAGALKRLLPAVTTDYDLVGMSGTSGGALCAVTAWYGLMTDGPARATELLDAVWRDTAATSPAEQILNETALWRSRIEDTGFPIPQVSPYTIPGHYAQRWFRQLVERHIEFERFDDLATATSPRVTIAAVNVNLGTFETFTDAAITPEAMVASAAVPHLFEAVEVNDHWHWDGLFSQNPPVRDFLTGGGPKPDELWVIQINPQTRDSRPTSLGEITDRRNELAGNLSLTQELQFIETVNEWVEEGYLPDEYKHVEVRCLTLDRDLDYASKFDADLDFIRELMAVGEAQAERFLAGDLDDSCPGIER